MAQYLTGILAALSFGCTAAAQSWLTLPAHVPLAAAAWDPVRERLLLAGIDSAQQQRLHEWDGSTARERPEELLGQPTVQHLLTDRPGHRVLALSTGSQVGTWNGGNWSWRSGGATLPTGDRSVAYDEHRQRLVVVTGNGVVHEWDGTTWWAVGNSTIGLAVAGAAFAYDPTSLRCVLYGGAAGANAETWTWDGFAWSLLSANSPPGPRAHAGLVFDPVQNRRLLLYGGSPTAIDTWAFDSSGWNLLTQDPAVGALEDCRLFAGDLGAVLLATGGAQAGAVWQLAGSQWLLQGRLPLARYAGREPLAVDPVRGTIVAFGGFGVFDRTWLAIVPAHRPPDRIQGHLAFSNAGQHMVAFGGLGNTASFGDTWTWDGVDWQARSGPGPAPRCRGMMTEGPNGTVVLFGGVDGATYFGDTWVWDGLGWQQRTPAVTPAPRAYALSAYDPLRATMVVWGGYNQTATYADQTWTWDGAAWTLTPTTAPLATAGSCFFHGGIGAIVAVGSTTNWVWNGTTWSAQPGYGATAVRGVIHHPRRSQVVELGYTAAGPTARVLASIASDVTPYGTSCAFGPPPAIAVVGAPRPDSVLDLELTTRAPLAPAFVVTGLSTQNTPLGGGCRALVGSVLGVHFALADGGGIVRLPLAIPGDPALRGVQFAAQGAVLDPAASPLGSVTTTAGLLLTLGD